VFGCDEYKCLGPYTADFCEKTPGGGAPHHPGRLMHKLRGENLAYFYLSILIEAVEDVCRLLGCERSAETLAAAAAHVGGDEANLGTSGSAASVANFSVLGASSGAVTRTSDVRREVLRIRRLNLLQQVNTDRYISSALNLTHEHIPAVTGKPTVTSKAVHAFVTQYLRQIQEAPLPPVPAAYNISELSSERPQCYTNFEPRIQNALSEIVVPQHSNWKSELSFLDAAAVLKSATKGYGYIDRKYVYTSVGINSTLVVTVRVSRPSAVWLCEVQKGFAKYPSTVADLIEGAEVYADLHSHSSTGLKGAAGNNVTYSPPHLAGMKRVGKFLFNTVACTRGGFPKPACQRTGSIIFCRLRSALSTCSFLFCRGAMCCNFQTPCHMRYVHLCDTELFPFYIQCYRTNPLPAGAHTLVLVQKADKLVSLYCFYG
jgi:hypothetical protein